MAARMWITGDAELEGKLRHLEMKVADRIAKSCLSAGLTVLARGMKKLAPVGETGALKASIGRRLEKGKRGGVFTAKAGINVGKISSKQAAKDLRRIAKAPHSHLVALGTKPRTRKTIGGKFGYIKNPTSQQLSTGSMPSNEFVRIAYLASKSAVAAAMRRRAEWRLIVEAERLSK